jgi:cytoskeletal protein RodZ
MALSMDEQRMLAEIERRLAAEDPGLAAKLSSFRRPGPAVRFRSTRHRVIGSLFTVALLAVVSLMIYAMVPFRAHSPKTTTFTPQASTSAPARAGTPAATAASAAPKTSTPAHTPAAKATSPKTTTAAKTTAAKKTAAHSSLPP